jgi:glycosyltransferase 2 family protein
MSAHDATLDRRALEEDATPTSTPLVEPDHPASHGRRWIGLVVSAVAIAGFVWWALRQEKPTIPTSAEALSLLGAAVLVYAVATLARGWRWHVLLRRSGVQHHAVDAYALVPVGYMGNTILPARGGELLRIVLLSGRSPARKREIAGAIVAERLLDALILTALFCGLTFAGIADTSAGSAPAWIGLALLVAAAAGGVVAMRLRRHPRLAPVVEKIRPVAAASVLLMRPVGALLALVTAAVWLLEGFIFYLVGQSLDLPIGIVDGVFLVVLASFFALIPAAPAYAGTFDAAIVFGLKALDITGGAAVSFAILVRAVLFVPVTLVGLVLVLTRYGGWKTLRLGRGQAAEPERSRRAR